MKVFFPLGERRKKFQQPLKQQNSAQEQPLDAIYQSKNR
jgi:hypothetical protein